MSGGGGHPAPLSPGEKTEREMKWEATLLRWQRMYDSALHSDRMAGDIGIFVLKGLIVLPGAALIALMTMFGTEIGKPIAQDLVASGGTLLWGLALAFLGSFFAYIYQSIVTRDQWNELDAVSNDKDTSGRPSFAASVTFTVFVLAPGIGSFVCFILGAKKILDALQALSG